MTRTLQELVAENNRLKERIERLHSETAWMESELRMVRHSPDFVLVRPGNLTNRLAASDILVGPFRDMPSATVWPTGKQPAYSLRPPPGLANYAMDRHQMKVLGIAVCGLEPDAIARVVAMIEDRQRRNGDFSPVFLTDTARTDIFRRRAYAFECLPEFDTTSEASQSYVARRIAFLEEKWGMAGIINFGRSAHPFGSVSGGGSPDGGGPEGEAADATARRATG